MTENLGVADIGSWLLYSSNGHLRTRTSGHIAHQAWSPGLFDFAAVLAGQTEQTDAA